MPDKLDRCVDDIKAKGKADGVNPYAVCNASIGEAHEPPYIPEGLNPFASNSLDVSAGTKESLNPQDRLDKTNYQPTTHSDPHKTLDPEPTHEARDPYKTLDPEPKHDGHRDPYKTLDPKMSELDKIEQEAVAIGGGLSAQSVGGKRHKEGGQGSGRKPGSGAYTPADAHLFAPEEKKKALPKKGVTPMGKKRTSSSATRVNEIESLCECGQFNKLHETLMREAEDDTEWITVKGAHIPIKKGENKDEVVKSFIAKQGGEPGEKKTGLSAQSESQLVKSIKGGSKNWKDWGRTEKTEKEYAEIERRNREVPIPKKPEGVRGTIFQDDPNAISKMEAKVKYLEGEQDYWKKIIKFPSRDYENRNQLGDAKWYAMSNNSANLRDAKKKLTKIQERKESGTTLERKPTYKGGKKRFYYKEKPKEGSSETLGSNMRFNNVLTALEKETS